MKEYIIAGTYMQAKRFSSSLKLEPTEWVYVAGVQCLMGIESPSITLCGSYKYRPDYKELVEILTTMRNVVIRKEIHMRDIIGEL